MNIVKKMARECYRPIKRRMDKKRAGPSYEFKFGVPPTYNQDGLLTFHKCSFMKDPAFDTAYQRGVQAVNQDYTIHWRVHVALWAATNALKLEGDFVECGVNKGFLSSSVMQYLNWNSLKRRFYLFDTFCGLDPALLNEEENEENLMAKSNAYYRECYEVAKQNFSEFKNVTLIRGSVPATLSNVEISKVAYLSIDMNCVKPEIAAAEYFWPKLSCGAMVVLDDYAYGTSTAQQRAFDQFAKEKNTSILSLPTGQGLMIKTAANTVP